MAKWKIIVSATAVHGEASPLSDEDRILMKEFNPYVYNITTDEILHWPPRCPCCGSLADSKQRIDQDGAIGDHLFWLVPYCKKCSDHSQMYVFSIFWLLSPIPFVAMEICALMSAQPVEWIVPAIMAIFESSLLLLSWYCLGQAHARMTNTCCAIAKPVSYQGKVGSIHTFRFASKEYGITFANLNQSKFDVLE